MRSASVLILKVSCWILPGARAGNEPNKLENNLRLDSIINLLNLVHEPNEPNLSSKLSSLNKRVELELCLARLVWFMNQLDIYIDTPFFLLYINVYIFIILIDCLKIWNCTVSIVNLKNF